MPADAPTPLPTRASDSEREDAVRALRERSLEGRLSTDTFSRRVGRVYEARTRDELDELVRDLPPESRGMGLIAKVVSRVSAQLAELEDAWRRPRLQRLALPSDARLRMTIGRSQGCDVVLADPTVSRHHAALLRHHEEWTLVDLGSTNGTRLNGLRLVEPAPVRPGDRVTFGGSHFRVGAL